MASTMSAGAAPPSPPPAPPSYATTEDLFKMETRIIKWMVGLLMAQTVVVVTVVSALVP